MALTKRASAIATKSRKLTASISQVVKKYTPCNRQRQDTPKLQEVPQTGQLLFRVVLVPFLDMIREKCSGWQMSFKGSGTFIIERAYGVVVHVWSTAVQPAID
jgi:hypothetical protein